MFMKYVWGKEDPHAPLNRGNHMGAVPTFTSSDGQDEIPPNPRRSTTLGSVPDVQLTMPAFYDSHEKRRGTDSCLSCDRPQGLTGNCHVLSSSPLSYKNSIPTLMSEDPQEEMQRGGLGLEITELRLGLPGVDGPGFAEKSEKKRGFSEITGEGPGLKVFGDLKAPVAKSQVVGWPPVCSYRKKNSFMDRGHVEGSKNTCVKVSMDGAIYLRKVDLGVQKGYSELAVALEKLFGCYGIGEGLKDAESGEHRLIYEDRDGDWMLVGDVPWEMFIETCKRLRIMKRSEASQGHGPVAGKRLCQRSQLERSVNNSYTND